MSTDATADPSPMSFNQVVVPFFRGQVCVPHEVESGANIPVSISACLHPCLEPSSYEFKHFFSCIGSSCEAYATSWIVADSAPEGCPADAFGRFDASQCVYEDPINLAISTSLDSGPISGTMLLEIPFLTNEDIGMIAGFGGSNDDAQDFFEMKVKQYPQDYNRVPDGRAIQLLSSNPTPPTSCADMACPCYEVGF